MGNILDNDAFDSNFQSAVVGEDSKIGTKKFGRSELEDSWVEVGGGLAGGSAPAQPVLKEEHQGNAQEWPPLSPIEEQDPHPQEFEQNGHLQIQEVLEVKEQQQEKPEPEKPKTVDAYGDDLSAFEFKIGNYSLDDEIEELKQWMNPRESKKKVNFSKNGLIEYFEKLLSEESPAAAQGGDKSTWQNVFNETNQQLWCKKEKDNDNLTVRAEFYYPKKFSVNKVARCILDPELRKQWDKLLNMQTVTSLPADGGQNISRLYTLNKQKQPLEARDIDEKRFVVYTNDKLYCYSSSCYQKKGSKLVPMDDLVVPPETTRADSVFNLITIERQKSDGRLKLTQVACFDLKSNLPIAMLDGLITKAFKKCFVKLQVFYISNYKKI